MVQDGLQRRDYRDYTLRLRAALGCFVSGPRQSLAQGRLGCFPRVSVKHLSDRCGQNILLLSMITLIAGGQSSLTPVAGVSASNKPIFLLGFGAINCAAFFLLHR